VKAVRRPVLYSTSMGYPAFGKTNQVSDFTAALLKGLSTCGVRNVGGQNWVVQPPKLHEAITALMDDFVNEPLCEMDGTSGHDFELHVLQQPPEVVLHVKLNDPAASPTASISCSSGGALVTRNTQDHPWRTMVPAGTCDIKADFAPPTMYQVATMQVPISPPFQDILLEVT
jgi:hypothetical protein